MNSVVHSMLHDVIRSLPCLFPFFLYPSFCVSNIRGSKLKLLSIRMFGPPFTVDAKLPVDFDVMVYQHHGRILPFVRIGPTRGFGKIAYVQGKKLLEMIASGSLHLDQDAVFVDHKSKETGGDGRIALKVTYVLPEQSRPRSLTIHCSRHIKFPGRYAQGLYVTAHEQVISRFHDANLQRLQYSEA